MKKKEYFNIDEFCALFKYDPNANELFMKTLTSSFYNANMNNTVIKMNNLFPIEINKK